MNKFLQVLDDWATARNGIDYSFTKAVFAVAVVTISYKFCVADSADYLGYAGGVTALIAAMAAKYHVEK